MRLTLGRLSLGILAATVLSSATAAIADAAKPVLGSYAGTTTTQAAGNAPQAFHITITKGSAPRRERGLGTPVTAPPSPR
jgi:hypothetical protein